MISGPSLLFASYTEYWESTYGSGLPVSVVVWGIGFSMCLLSVIPPSKWRTAALIALMPFVFLALPLGIRSSVLIPGVVSAFLVTRRRGQPRLWFTALAAMITLLGFSLLRNVREVGLGAVEGSNLVANPVHALLEMGASLRSISEIVAWHQDGEEWLRGASYWAPFDRQICRLPYANDCISGLEDNRLTYTVVMSRVGHIGLSPVAEAFHNFGTPGVIGVMAIIGLILGSMDRWATSPLKAASLGLVLLVILLNLRSGFITVPARLFLGFGFLGLIAVADYIKSNRVSR
jgi:hypothetical protein